MYSSLDSIEIFPFVVGEKVACYTFSSFERKPQTLDLEPTFDAMVHVFVHRFERIFKQIVDDHKRALRIFLTHPVTNEQQDLIYVAIRKQKILGDIRRISNQDLCNFQWVLENMLQPQQSSPTH